MWKMGKRLIKMFMKCFVNSNKSSTFAPAIENDALLAQLVEQLTLKFSGCTLSSVGRATDS